MEVQQEMVRTVMVQRGSSIKVMMITSDLTSDLFRSDRLTQALFLFDFSPRKVTSLKRYPANSSLSLSPSLSCFGHVGGDGCKAKGSSAVSGAGGGGGYFGGGGGCVIFLSSSSSSSSSHPTLVP